MDGFFAGTAGPNAGFGARGDTIVSVERISPIVVLELERTGQGKTETSRTLVGTVGDTPSSAPVQRQARLAVDAALTHSLTVGGSVYFATIAAGAGNASGTAAGFAPRIGHVIPLGGSLALWPRAGVSYVAVAAGAPGGGASARVEATFDTALCVFPSPGVALTLTPAVDMALAGRAPIDLGSTARIAFTGGILGHFPDDAPTAERASLAPARALAKGGAVTISADRLLPIADYVRFDDPGPGTPSWQLESGLTHAFTPDHELMPRFAADITVARGITMGFAFAFNITPWESVRRTAYLDATGRAVYGPVDIQDLHAVSVGVEPRLGWVTPLGDRTALWIRGGFTYVVAYVYQPGTQAPVTTASGAVTLSSQSYDDQAGHRLDLSFDPEVIYFITQGFGVSAGPVVDATVLGGFHDRDGGFPIGLPGPPMFHAGATAGALVSF
jgi:hypothetical protein